VNRVRDEAMGVMVQSSVGALLDLQSFTHLANYSVSDSLPPTCTDTAMS
jgi:hypothetical protein